MKIGFTGTQTGMTTAQMEKVEIVMRELASPGFEFHHGDCIGSDFQAVRIARETEYVIVIRRYMGLSVVGQSLM